MSLTVLLQVAGFVMAALSLVLHAMHRDKAAAVVDEVKAADDKLQGK